MGDIYIVPSIPTTLGIGAAIEEIMSYSVVAPAELGIDLPLAIPSSFSVVMPTVLAGDSAGNIGYQSSIETPVGVNCDASIDANAGFVVTDQVKFACDAGTVSSISLNVTDPVMLEADSSDDSIVIAIHCTDSVGLSCASNVLCGKDFLIEMPASLAADTEEAVTIAYSVLQEVSLFTDTAQDVVTKSFVITSVGMDASAGEKIGHVSSIVLPTILGINASGKITDNLTTLLMLALYGQSLQATTFSNFNFDSFIEEKGITYASGPDGIYKVGELTTDDGVVINPEVTIDFKRLDSNKIKQLRAIYAEGSSKCVVDLDDVTKDYTANASGKFACSYNHLGKDLKITFSDFTSLSDVEMFFYHLERRI